MKNIVLTFDDGRADNYRNAYKIMSKYNMSATLFITTGYVDGSWNNREWLSGECAMTVDEVKELYASSYEIALHGDRHTAERSDFAAALNKLREWNCLPSDGRVGFSLPNSNASIDEINALRNEFSDELIYIRGGRRCNTRSLYYRILYALYNITGSKLAFKLFNKENIIQSQEITGIFDGILPCVVVKKSDSSQQLVSLFDSMPDDSVCILMLHSVLDKKDPYYGRDSWCWDTENFEKLIKYLAENEEICVCTLRQLYEQTKLIW